MPPKRKVTPDDDEAASIDSTSPAPKGKKAKAAPRPKKMPVPVTPLNLDYPHNTEVEVPVGGFPAKAESTTRISAFNVCGIRASLKKGLSKYILAENADILILTETKVNEHFDFHPLLYPFQYWGSDPKKGYAGTAILSKVKPISTVYGLPTLLPQVDSNGRCVTLEFESYYLVGTYVPNAGQKLVTIDKKAAWNDAFEIYLHELDAKKPVVWGGDINCVRDEKDIRNWHTNHNKSAGCTDIEIVGYLAQVLPAADSGRNNFVDVWRRNNPDVLGAYTFYNYMRQARSKGIGWRIDALNVSERISSKVVAAEIRSTVYGASDHVPIIIDIEV